MNILDKDLSSTFISEENNTNENNTDSESNNGGGNTQTQPTQPSKPATPTIVSGYIGNTGLLFNTYAEAYDYGEQKAMIEEQAERWIIIGVFYSDGTKKYSVDLV